jgi:hypothetical protein
MADSYSVHRHFDQLTLFTRKNRIFVIFAALAVAMRVLFQVMTLRTWEDALILDSVTKNLWAGAGLTHQAAEPSIQSFSSVIWMLFSLLGNSVGQGILFLKLISLLATVATIWFAYSIAKKWRISTPGIILILGFLSFEQIHVTFGAAGMESQFATAFILFGIWSFLQGWRVALILTATLAPLVRPELVFWTLLVLVIYLIRPNLFSSRAAIISVTPLALWLLFAWSYYGTIIPQTVTAKSLIGTTNLSKSGLFPGIDASLNSWERVAPYFSNYFASSALIPRDFGLVIVLVLVALFVAGSVRVAKMSRTWLIPAFVVPIFVLYVGFFNVSNYHMWYVPPFSAVLILYAGAAFGKDKKTTLKLTYPLVSAILLLYLIPTISYFQHEAYVQKEVDTLVRQSAGQKLNSLMSVGQTVVLEPLGFLGSEVTSGQVNDYPGLASRIMTEALEDMPSSERNMGSAARVIQPDFIVVRQNEWQSFSPREHSEFQGYKFVASVGEPTKSDLAFFGATYSNSDRYFEIYAK